MTVKRQIKGSNCQLKNIILNHCDRDLINKVNVLLTQFT